MAQQGSPTPWTLEEDHELRRLVWELVLSQAPPPLRRPWRRISTLLASSLDIEPRHPKQCRLRWDDVLNMVLETDNWSAQESQQLLSGYLTHGGAWTTIARNYVNGRTPSACRSHLKLLLERGDLARLGDHELLPLAPAAAPRRRTAAPRPPAALKPGARPSKGGKPAGRKAPTAAAPPPPPPPAIASVAQLLLQPLPPMPRCAAPEVAWRREWGVPLPSDSELLDVDLPCCSCHQPFCCGSCDDASTPAAPTASVLASPEEEDDDWRGYLAPPCDAAGDVPAIAMAMVSSEEEADLSTFLEFFCDEAQAASAAAAAAAAPGPTPAGGQWDTLQFQS